MFSSPIIYTEMKFLLVQTLLFQIVFVNLIYAECKDSTNKIINDVQLDMPYPKLFGDRYGGGELLCNYSQGAHTLNQWRAEFDDNGTPKFIYTHLFSSNTGGAGTDYTGRVNFSTQGSVTVSNFKTTDKGPCKCSLVLDPGSNSVVCNTVKQCSLGIYPATVNHTFSKNTTVLMDGDDLVFTVNFSDFYTSDQSNFKIYLSLGNRTVTLNCTNRNQTGGFISSTCQSSFKVAEGDSNPTVVFDFGFAVHKISVGQIFIIAPNPCPLSWTIPCCCVAAVLSGLLVAGFFIGWLALGILDPVMSGVKMTVSRESRKLTWNPKALLSVGSPKFEIHEEMDGNKSYEVTETSQSEYIVKEGAKQKYEFQIFAKTCFRKSEPVKAEVELQDDSWKVVKITPNPEETPKINEDEWNKRVRIFLGLLLTCDIILLALGIAMIILINKDNDAKECDDWIAALVLMIIALIFGIMFLVICVVILTYYCGCCSKGYHGCPPGSPCPLCPPCCLSRKIGICTGTESTGKPPGPVKQTSGKTPPRPQQAEVKNSPPTGHPQSSVMRRLPHSPNVGSSGSSRRELPQPANRPLPHPLPHSNSELTGNINTSMSPLPLQGSVLPPSHLPPMDITVDETEGVKKKKKKRKKKKPAVQGEDDNTDTARSQPEYEED